MFPFKINIASMKETKFQNAFAIFMTLNNEFNLFLAI